MKHFPFRRAAALAAIVIAAGAVLAAQQPPPPQGGDGDSLEISRESETSTERFSSSAPWRSKSVCQLGKRARFRTRSSCPGR